MAELEAVVTDINTVPEAARAFYVEKDGKHVLSVKGELPGFVPALKHAEMRQTNISLLRAIGAETPEAALARVAVFAGIDTAKLEKLKAIDPEEYATLKAQADELGKKGVKKPDDLQAAITAALDGFKKEVVAPLQADLTATKTREQAKDQRIADATLREAVAARFTKAGGRSDAGVLDFIISRAKDAGFKASDDKVTAPEGKFGPTGEPLTLDDWMLAATREHVFAFEASNGGGAAPANGGVTPRAGAKQLVNPTPQQLGRYANEIAKGEMVVVSN